MPNLTSVPLSLTEIWRESQNLKSRSDDRKPHPFDPILHILLRTPQGPFTCQIWFLYLLSVMEIWRGSQNFKSRSRDPGHAPFDPNLHFCLVPFRNLLRAKFGVSSFMRSGDMEGVPKLKNRSRDQGHAPFETILHCLLSTHQGSFECQIWCL